MSHLVSIVVAALAVTAAAAAPGLAHAQGYLEQKDNDNVGIVERALAKIAREPTLFDGVAIPPGADLVKVAELSRRLSTQLGVARKHHDEMSAAARARPAVQALMAKWNDLAAYADALVPVYNAAANAANDQAARQAVVDATAREAGIKACVGFRTEVDAEPSAREHLDRAVQIVDGVDTHWQTVEQGAQHRATMVRVAALCARPEYADLDRACAHVNQGLRTNEARWCEVSARVDLVMQHSARNLAAWMAESLGPGRTADELAQHDGWVDIEGPVTWTEYLSGAKLRAQITERLQPVFAQAGVADVEDLDVFARLASHFATLEAKVRELAPGWDLPGSACAGVACAAARKTATAWYPKAAIKAVRQKEAGWKVVQNRRGIPTHRYKSGFVLLAVKGDPLCQLRAWTVSEDHRGGGRYEVATGAKIGYVRWQPCK